MKTAPVLALAALLAIPPAFASSPTREDALAFVAEAEGRLATARMDAGRASWVHATYITEDTETLDAQGGEKLLLVAADLAKKAARFEGLDLPADVARKLRLLKGALPLAAPPDPRDSAELTRIASGMEGAYGRGKVCLKGPESCLSLEAVSRRMAESRDPEELKALWTGWHAVGAPMRGDYTRFVELANKGAAGLGYADTGAMWRSRYDMPADAFAKEVDRLWEQVKPLYLALHAYVRFRLRERYGDAVPERAPIPAHLLGDMWAQSWANIDALVAPKGPGTGIDLTKTLESRKTDARAMVRTGEAFFGSVGFAPLPKTFWERSLFVRPRDREVVCHASAWDLDEKEDLRIKMCIEPVAEDFATVHHELGHLFYDRAYAAQSPLFRDSAHDGFHEAVGDTIALSITPAYLKTIGLVAAEPPAGSDTGLLLARALEKVAFLPFGIVIDQWRWKVFSGEIPPARYNEAWWELRRRYQGVAPPAPRTEAAFDPGAKYHVPANVPYVRYFLADILQFQFHRALSRAAGCKGPLHGCSIYGNREAGRRLMAMLEMGQSRPWPDALEALTGERRMDASALLEYFAPLRAWLDAENRGHPTGW